MRLWSPGVQLTFHLPHFTLASGSASLSVLFLPPKQVPSSSPQHPDLFFSSHVGRSRGLNLSELGKEAYLHSIVLNSSQGVHLFGVRA
jgi:hypothetical protein